jgi:alanine-glyoxylate transaminase / serine-glyoxylate transaminase / serine-pyruvate transaminase
VRIPAGIDDMKIRQRLLNEYNIEISGGLGPLKGKIWRIGLMGYSSTQENVLLFLSAFEKILQTEGYKVEPGSGIAAAIKTLRS